MPPSIVARPNDRHALEGIYGHIEAAMHRSGPTTELLDARNELAVYMARPAAKRKQSKRNNTNTIYGRLSAHDQRQVDRLLKEKFPAIYADRLAPNAYVPPMKATPADKKTTVSL